MTRDEARQSWKVAGLTYLDLTRGRVQRLRSILDRTMRQSDLIKPATGGRGTLRMMGSPNVSIGERGFHVELQCKAFYFRKREAVTFCDNGFIGFAGWADPVNVQPILEGFVEWVAWMVADIAAANGRLAA